MSARFTGHYDLISGSIQLLSLMGRMILDTLLGRGDFSEIDRMLNREGRKLMEGKSTDSVVAVCDAVRVAGAQDRVCLSSFSAQRLGKARELTEGRVTNSLSPIEVARLVFASWRATRNPVWKDRKTIRRILFAGNLKHTGATRAVQIPLRHFHGLVPLVTRTSVALAHTAGLDVHVWTVNDPAMMRQLLTGSLCIDGIMTDYPKLGQQILRSL